MDFQVIGCGDTGVDFQDIVCRETGVIFRVLCVGYRL